MKIKLSLFMCLALACASLSAQEVEVNTNQKALRVGLADGQLQGQLFAMVGTQKAPLVGKVALTDTNGKTVSVADAGSDGQFSFTDVVPGKYHAIGIAGDYVGDTEVEVVAVAVASEDTEAGEEVYTAIALPVAQASGSAIFDSYASLPLGSFSSTPSLGAGSSCCGCSGSCSSFGGRGGGLLGGRLGGGGFNFRRFALLGAAVAIPIALSGGDDDGASPAGL